MTSLREARAAGLNMLGTLATAKGLYGEDVFARALQIVCPELRQAYQSSQILAISWYPVEWLRSFYGAMRQVTGMGTELPRTVSYASTLHDFNGIFRLLVHALPTSLVFAKATRLFGKYYDLGTVTEPKVAGHTAIVSWSGCVGFDENIWSDLIGGCVAILEVTGAHAVASNIRSGGGNNDQDLAVTFTWS